MRIPKPNRVSILSSLIHLHTCQTYLPLRGDHHSNSKCNIQSYVNYLNHNVHWICNFLEKILYVKHMKDWSIFFLKLCTLNVRYYVNSLSKSISCATIITIMFLYPSLYQGLYGFLHSNKSNPILLEIGWT